MTEEEARLMDEEFARMTQQLDQEEEQNRKKKGKEFNFEKIHWSGLETKKMKIYRFLGGSNFNTNVELKPSDAREVRIGRLIDDKNKQMRIILPVVKEDRYNSTNKDLHILYRIVNTVNAVIWVPNPNAPPNVMGKQPNMKVYVHEKSAPDIFNIVNYSSLPISDPRRKFGLMGRGWLGKEVFLVNAIDRERMDWHRENKHSILISKNVNIQKNPDGTVVEFVDEGVPAYGFVEGLRSLIQYYNYWGRYDIGIEKTGQANPAYRVANLSRTPEVAPANIRHLISNVLTTDEESSWETYNLNTLFKTTSYTKIWNRLRVTIGMIDSRLGSKFVEELAYLKDEEEKNFSKVEEESDDLFSEETIQGAIESEEQENMEESSRPIITLGRSDPLPLSSPNASVKNLLGYKLMTPEEIEGIIKVSTVGTGTSPSIIEYAPKHTKKLKCRICQTSSPESYSVCPGCGEVF